MKYQVVIDGWLDGEYRTAGEIIELSADAAKYLLLNGQIVVAPADPVSPRTVLAEAHQADASPAGAAVPVPAEPRSRRKAS